MNRKNQIIIDRYRTDINAEIMADTSKNSWGTNEWFAFYVDTQFVIKDFQLTRRAIFNVLGVIKGEAIMAAIRSNYPELADQLKVTEGGVNINHPDFDGISSVLVSAAVISQEDADLIKALSLKQEQRWQTKGLPELKIGHIQSALGGV